MSVRMAFQMPSQTTRDTITHPHARGRAVLGEAVQRGSQVVTGEVGGHKSRRLQPVGERFGRNRLSVPKWAGEGEVLGETLPSPCYRRLMVSQHAV